MTPASQRVTNNLGNQFVNQLVRAEELQDQLTAANERIAELESLLSVYVPESPDPNAKGDTELHGPTFES